MKDTDVAEGEPHSQVAEVKAEFGKAKFEARVKMTPRGLLAVGALVGGILLSTSVLVWVATSPVRRHPLASRLPLP